MILNKDTREQIEVGTKLRLGEEIVQVTGIFNVYRGTKIIGKQISVEWLQSTNLSMIGCNLYCEKLSSFYGWEIVKEESK